MARIIEYTIRDENDWKTTYTHDGNGEFVITKETGPTAPHIQAELNKIFVCRREEQRQEAKAKHEHWNKYRITVAIAVAGLVTCLCLSLAYVLLCAIKWERVML